MFSKFLWNSEYLPNNLSLPSLWASLDKLRMFWRDYLTHTYLCLLPFYLPLAIWTMKYSMAVAIFLPDFLVNDSPGSCWLIGFFRTLLQSLHRSHGTTTVCWTWPHSKWLESASSWSCFVLTYIHDSVPRVNKSGRQRPLRGCLSIMCQTVNVFLPRNLNAAQRRFYPLLRLALRKSGSWTRNIMRRRKAQSKTYCPEDHFGISSLH